MRPELDEEDSLHSNWLRRHAQNDFKDLRIAEFVREQKRNRKN